MVLQDVRYGLRTLRRSPGFTGAASAVPALRAVRLDQAAALRE